MYIEFTTLRYKNFLASGNTFTEINLNKSKTTLFVGTNGNGKSTFIDAICFALFNKPFRKINKPQLVNSINKKNCIVEVEFNTSGKSYLIRRGIKPAIFEIVEDGITKSQDPEIKDHQEVLEKTILKMNFKTFCQVVILGAANYTPFMQLVAAARREIIEDLLDLQILTVMNVLVKQRMSDLSAEYETIDKKDKLLKQKIFLLKKRQEEITETNSEFVAENEAKIKDKIDLIQNAEAEIKAIEKDIMFYNAQIKALGDPAANLKQYNRLHNQLNHNLETSSKEIKFFSDHDNCPTCRQVIDTTFKVTVIQEKTQYNQEVTEALNQLGDRIKAAQEVQDKISELKEKISNENSKIANKRVYIKMWKELIDTLNKQNAEQIQKTSQQLDDKELTDAEDNHKITSKALIELKAEGNLLSMATSILKDGGIKTQLVKKFIPIINQTINKYLAAFEFFVQFELDETFSETIKSRFRDEFSYNSFSEGEKRRIDLAIMLSWRAIAKMRNSASTNLLIMDEVLDGPLDASGKDDLIRLLQEVVKDTNLIIISHDNAFKDKFDKIVEFKKEKHFSIIMEESNE